MSDFYKTLKGVSQGIYKEKMSKFIAIAQPAQSADEAKALIKQIANKYQRCATLLLGLHGWYQAQ